jgi:YHS domain-containing protein
VSPRYGTQYQPIASPQVMPQQQPPLVAQQQPPFVAQQPISPPQNPQNNVVLAAPTGNPVFALDGCCPVSLVEKQRWVAGDSRWGANHRGRVYLFAGPEEQRRFFADPDRYAPVISGNDIVLAAEQSQVVPGTRAYGVYYKSHVYLFSTEASRAKFEANPAAYSNQALEAQRSSAYHPGLPLR